MRINIINLDKESWILTKFAKNLFFNLKMLGHETYLTGKAIGNVDVNHYIIFLFQKEDAKSYYSKTINTSLLTHVNDDFRYKKIKAISKFMDAGITFSYDHLRHIKSKSLGIKKLFAVLPPCDGDLNLKKTNFGFFTNLYSDGRKSQDIFVNTVKSLNKDLVKFSIIGKGWSRIVKELRSMGYDINYQRFFLRRRYIGQLNNIDYLIYLGNDEGSMSFMDALQLGVKTIMIPQGFQKDLEKYITHKLRKDLNNFKSILKNITDEKQKFADIKNKLNWKNYAMEHIKIWTSLIKK